MSIISSGQKILQADHQKQLGELWISGVGFARLSQNLQNNNITAVCSVIVSRPLIFENSIKNLTVCIEDHPDLDFKQVKETFQKCYSFIEMHRAKRQNVLVHCIMGVSRSAAVCCFYLIKKYCFQYTEALGLIKKVRLCIKINKGFQNFLINFQKSISVQKRQEETVSDSLKPAL